MTDDLQQPSGLRVILARSDNKTEFEWFEDGPHGQDEPIQIGDVIYNPKTGEVDITDEIFKLDPNIRIGKAAETGPISWRIRLRRFWFWLRVDTREWLALKIAPWLRDEEEW